jgi:hypothetical protein
MAERTREELEGALDLAEHRIRELRKEIDDQRDTITKMRENVEDLLALNHDWAEVFDMPLSEDGKRTWSGDLFNQLAQVSRLHDEHEELLRDWNRLVTKWNASGLTEPLPPGRPMKASADEQQMVLEHHAAGLSLRAIADETGLSLRSIRTVIGKATGTDRSTKREAKLRTRRLKAERQRAWRQRRASIEALPRRLNEALETGAELVKLAKEGARRL